MPTYKPCPQCGTPHHHFAKCPTPAVDQDPIVVSRSFFPPDRPDVRTVDPRATNQFARGING